MLCFSDTPTCLLTGATGRLGRLSADRLAAELGPGIPLLRQTRHRVTGPGWVAWSLAEGSRPDFEASGPPPRVDVVIHLAGVTPNSGPDPDFADNVHLGRTIAEYCLSTGVRHLFLASSASVYGRPGRDPLDERAPARPISAYGASKLQTELLVRQRLQGSATGVTALRIGNVAGADQLLLNAARATDAAPLRLDRLEGGAALSRSYIGPGALAQIWADLVRRALAGQDLPDILNIAAPLPVDMAALAAAYAHRTRPFAVLDRPASATAIPSVHLDSRRLGAMSTLARVAGTADSLVSDWLDTRGALA